MQQRGTEAQKGRHFRPYARAFGPDQPVVQTHVEFQMYHAVGKRARHAVRDGPVLFAVACGHHHPAFGQNVFADAPVENELIAGGLHQGRSGVQLIEKKYALPGALRIGQKGRRTPLGSAGGRDAGNAPQIHRVEQYGAYVAQLIAQRTGHFRHHLAFAHPGSAPEEYGPAYGKKRF